MYTVSADEFNLLDVGGFRRFLEFLEQLENGIGPGAGLLEIKAFGFEEVLPIDVLKEGKTNEELRASLQN